MRNHHKRHKLKANLALTREMVLVTFAGADWRKSG
jgi:hypothetical protein